MGYVVLHLDKSPGNEAAMTDHIKRNVIPSNADPTRTHLNRELVELPDEVADRTEAIRHRIETAGLKRKVGKNQVQVIRIMLSGSQEDMQRIESEGRLDEWCRDNIDWLKKTYGEENLVAATLHMDETTPHIHASVVPIVQGERRKKKTNKERPEQPTKKKYRKKDANQPRLCADDVMARDKLTAYQDGYAEAMAKYDLQRGIKGSDARHITLTEFYREQSLKCENIQENIGLLLAMEDAKRLSIEQLKQQEQEAKEQYEQADKLKVQKELDLKDTEDTLNQVKGQLKTEELKSKAADVGSTIMEGIGSLVGTSKVKRQQQEIEALKTDKDHLTKEVNKLTHDMQTIQKEHQTIVDKLKDELAKIHDLFPKVKELLRIENLCNHLGFSDELTKMILDMKPVGFKGKLYSAEYKRNFETERSIAEIKPHPTEKDRLQLTIDEVSDTNWFRQKYREFQQSIGININQKTNTRKLN
ncbi:MobV family relaxase [uncultured Dysgonomonas sp.]|uniref:Plasmid recombination enzyme n=1 Tax=uncultured Dysgonomonas sp. TaxID=206096 RepID=A0A212JUD7_9BACT|nr:MobV family relaxase [uncultured Dysgonomonas sp.]SBW03074.1 conserved hypothetical protein [uncultured Dysgonomonas sp.]